MTRRTSLVGYTPLYLSALFSLIFLIVTELAPFRITALRRQMVEASLLMETAASSIKNCRHEKGLAIDAMADPNRTGLIGLEKSSITTTLGNLEAKRTTTNPNFAGLLVFLLHECGVKRGDVVAIGASSSFPSLIIASLAAAETMGLVPLPFISLGASEWGGNHPDFTWLDMENCLRRSGILDVKAVGLALGGEEDIGRDMSPEGREHLSTLIKGRDVVFLEEPRLERNVAARLDLYRKASCGKRIGAFINIGGSTANIGINPEVLKLSPGITDDVFIPPFHERGVLQAMAANGVPVIHLLFVKGLTERYGLPWDPQPLPTPGKGDIFRRADDLRISLVFPAVVYFLSIGALLSFAWRRRRFLGQQKEGRRRGASP